MAQAIASPAPPSHYNGITIHHDAASQASSHSKKRPADTSLETEQRLSKRFDLLHLDPSSHPIQTRLYTPISPSSRSPSSPPIDNASNSMHIDDTPHKIYIHDLSAELSSVDESHDPDHNPRIFIPDIERHLARIPKHVLTSGSVSSRMSAPSPVPVLEPTKDNQLILYNAPSVLELPEEQERIRKAIREAREKMRREGRKVEVEEVEVEEDPDAMDLD